MSDTVVREYQWDPQPEAWAALVAIVEDLVVGEASLASFAQRLRAETGTRLVDWIRALTLPANSPHVSSLLESGFSPTQPCRDGTAALLNHRGMFPLIQTRPDAGTPSHPMQLVITVEDVGRCVAAHRWDGDVVHISSVINGRPAAVVQLRQTQLLLLGMETSSDWQQALSFDDDLARHRQALLQRERDHADHQAGFGHAAALIDSVQRDLGKDLACDLFFAAEREYWQSRNRAARVQKERQDVMGLGWANHDHHTYRSSRECFVHLIAALEQLGLRCRERFYAGREAGWGAQVLERPETGIIVFADVDLSPEEVATDFAHQPLPPRETLGTVGLWCRLHGESYLQAGMHHLECQFDFAAACEQLAAAGIESMAPFTDFPFLKQAFTVGEMWPVAEDRIASALADGCITVEQAERFRSAGAIGSHLEILERNDAYKGFNQTGISDIIIRTDPRRGS